MFFSCFLFFLSFFLIVLYGVHYMILLLLLESLLLGYFLLCCWGFLASVGLSGLFIFLLLVVCMGGFGIALLVFMSRFFGRDFWVYGFLF